MTEGSNHPVRPSHGPDYGRVYINYPGYGWGTVCSDDFGHDDNGCQVVCRQLGYR